MHSLDPVNGLSPQDAYALLERAVAERGADYVYTKPPHLPHCVYSEPDGSPSCMIGLALSYLGISPKYMDIIGGSVGSLLHSTNADKRTVKVLQTAQLVQDGERTWGEALASAKRTLNDQEGVTHA